MRTELVSKDGYKDVIRNFITTHSHVAAYRTKMAKAAKCQPSFLSHVLHSHAHLTLDHAHRLAGFFDLDPLEREYFLTLVVYEKASDEGFRTHLRKQLTGMTNQKLGMRAGVTQFDSETRAALYFSEWKHTAIHSLLEIPGFQSTEAIAKRLKLRNDEVRKSLELLERVGVVKKEQARWKILKRDVHLPKHSPFEAIYHSAWRQRSMESLDRQTAGDVHYTAICALSERQLTELRQLLGRFMIETNRLASDEDGAGSGSSLNCVCLDLFQL